MARNSGDTTEISPWILGFRGASLPRPLARAIQAGRLCGVILFRDNLGGSVEAARELRREILSLRPPGRPFYLCADEEGGLISQVSRLSTPARSSARSWAGVPTPRALGRIDQPDACRFVGRMLGRRLQTLGLEVDFAPSLDLDMEAANPVIGSRSFGADPERVAALAQAFALGLADAGVTACYKHYPGHGSTRVDSHLALPRVDPEARARGLRPFRRCLVEATALSAGEDVAARDAAGAREPHQRHAGTPWVMTGHLDWGDGQPASLNRALLARLRRWNPGSLVVTDALEMRAVDLPGGAAAKALLAGNDLLLVGREWRMGLAAMDELESLAARDPRVRDALRRCRRRILRYAPAAGVTRQATEFGPRSSITGSKRQTSAPSRSEIPEEDERALRSLHLASARWSASPESLPPGPWLWVVPEGLSPYADLRSWRPARGRRRFCGEVQWVAEGAPPASLARLARSLREEKRPVLLATLFRGPVSAAARGAWAPLLRLPALRVVAHLLDESWPRGDEDERWPRRGEHPAGGSRPSESRPSARRPSAETAPGPWLVALTSGPSIESLDALAEAMELPANQWVRGRDGLYRCGGPASLPR